MAGPTVTSIDPDWAPNDGTGPGTLHVTITGDGFTGNAKVVIPGLRVDRGALAHARLRLGPATEHQPGQASACSVPCQ